MSTIAKPYSESCDQNKAPILAVLRKVFADTQQVLEIGSGTGQHAVYFGDHLPHVQWQTSDLAVYHAGINAWLAEAAPNVRPPLALDVCCDAWPVDKVDAIFSANTTHIMSWRAVTAMFAGIGRILAPNGVFVLYGPFNYGGGYTSESNARFDAWLKARDPLSGIRHFEEIDTLARAQGLTLWEDIEMPVNNRTLVWRREIIEAARM